MSQRQYRAIISVGLQDEGGSNEVQVTVGPFHELEELFRACADRSALASHDGDPFYAVLQWRSHFGGWSSWTTMDYLDQQDDSNIR